MMVAEQTQGYRISFELIGFVGTMKQIINFLCQLRLDPELMEHVHMKVWHQWWTANHMPWNCDSLLMRESVQFTTKY